MRVGSEKRQSWNVDFIRKLATLSQPTVACPATVRYLAVSTQPIPGVRAVGLWSMRLAALLCAVLLAGAAAVPAQDSTPPARGVAADWQILETGLAYAEIELPQKSVEGDSLARVLRADPAHFGLRLLNSSASPGGVARTAREWAQQAGAVAATNAAMFQADGSTSVSLMLTRDHVNNGHVSKDRSVLAFDRVDESLPPIQIIDRGCQDFDKLRSGYESFVQSIRMISCDGRNVWSPRQAQWSTALVATDGAGRILLIHVRSPYSTHDLIENLRLLPIAIERAMYLEGGRPAQLFFSAGGHEVEVVGSTSSTGLGGNRTALPFPNALALYRLPKPTP